MQLKNKEPKKMQRKDFKNNLILKHFDLTREVTNNLLFGNACTIEDSDKRMLFPTSLVKNMGWNDNIKSMYDYRMMYPGVYERLYQLCVISLCSDNEFLFKEIFDQYGYSKGNGNGFFQRFEDVISSLNSQGLDFTKILPDIENLKLAFQIRHIGIHNMGYVDNNFVSKTGKGTVGVEYKISQSDFRILFDSYQKLLEHLDSILP